MVEHEHDTGGHPFDVDALESSDLPVPDPYEDYQNAHISMGTVRNLRKAGPEASELADSLEYFTRNAVGTVVLDSRNRYLIRTARNNKV